MHSKSAHIVSSCHMLSKAVCKESCCAVENIVFKNLQVSVQLIEDTVDINVCSVSEDLKQTLMMTEVCVQ